MIMALSLNLKRELALGELFDDRDVSKVTFKEEGATMFIIKHSKMMKAFLLWFMPFCNLILLQGRSNCKQTWKITILKEPKRKKQMINTLCNALITALLVLW